VELDDNVTKDTGPVEVGAYFCNLRSDDTSERDWLVRSRSIGIDGKYPSYCAIASSGLNASAVEGTSILLTIPHARRSVMGDAASQRDTGVA
jgi:hypothetical protein